MATTRSVEEVLNILKRGDLDELLGTVEDIQVEFKGAPYQLANENDKCELAKDVSALANHKGGVILIGFRTKKDPSTAVEYVDSCRPFDRRLVDRDQYLKALHDWICPVLRSLEISYFVSRSNPDKFVVAIIVPEAVADEKPYVVTRSVGADGKVRGTLFGYYERVQDGIPATSAETIRGYIKDGFRFGELANRLSTIEAFLGSSPSPVAAGPTKEDICARIVSAEKVAGRNLVPNIILAATSLTECDFPDLFRSRSTPVVTLLENPPILRPDGFAVTPKKWDQPSDIIQGRSRRIVVRGSRLVELWKDGALIAVGPGDEDLLCWFMRNPKKHEPGLPIRNFVLAEVTLNFCRLAVEIFKNSKPAPQQLQFELKLNNMTEEGVPCTLSSGPDNQEAIWAWGGGKRSAPSAEVTGQCIAFFDKIDASAVAYQLLGDLYVQFGFNHDEMPYVQHDPDANRITPKSLFPRWPTQ